jgi:hypothetical protein
MAYFKDLTPYEYFARHEKPGTPVLNVGWLEGDDFEKGGTSREFQNNLFQFCLDPNIVMIARGFHECPYCNMSWINDHPDYGNNAHWMSIGDGEIRVIGKSVLYAAPALIYHYVIAHHYRPPQEFIDAVLNGPQPGSDEHRAILKKYQE